MKGFLGKEVEKMRRSKGLWVPISGILVTFFLLSISLAEGEFIKKGREGGIAFLSGGVGLSEREILKEMGRFYSLKLIFSNKKGEYLSNVNVEVFDHMNKNILTTVTNGPWLYIDLPSGTYHLEASVRGDRKRISGISVPQRDSKVISVLW